MKIAFYKATRPGLQGIFNVLVRWWTKGPYSHCELILEEYPDGTVLCGSASHLDGGVRLTRRPGIPAGGASAAPTALAGMGALLRNLERGAGWAALHPNGRGIDR